MTSAGLTVVARVAGREAAGVPFRALVVAGGTIVALGAGVATRIGQLHPGLLYPDGYQYLLMARGLAEHGNPTGRLGPAGDLFVPSADAAAKPLYPLLIAVADRIGVPPVEAARWITALAAGIVLVLAGTLVFRLTGSWLGAAVAWGTCLASPTLGYWSGFAGPDPLAQALALGAGAAAVSRRPTLAGVLGGLAITTRPEFAVIAVGCLAVASVATRDSRRAAGSAATAGLVTVGAVLVVVRPPIETPGWPLIIAGLGAAAIAAAASIGAARSSLVGLVACGAAVTLVAGTTAGSAVVSSDLLIVFGGLVGLGAAALSGRLRAPAGILAVCSASLAYLYGVKNPGSDRYLAALIPMAAIAVGLGTSLLQERRMRLLAAVALAIGLALSVAVAPSRPSAGTDVFAAIAPQLTDRPDLPLLTAAPDAFGYLLPLRSVRVLRPGSRGLVLLDGSQRLFEPGLAAKGKLLATFDQAEFRRPDGTIDHGDISLVQGVVVRR